MQDAEGRIFFFCANYNYFHRNTEFWPKVRLCLGEEKEDVKACLL